MFLWYPVPLIVQEKSKCSFRKQHINEIYAKFSIFWHQNQILPSNLTWESSLSKADTFFRRTRYNRNWENVFETAIASAISSSYKFSYKCRTQIYITIAIDLLLDYWNLRELSKLTQMIMLNMNLRWTFSFDLNYSSQNTEKIYKSAQKWGVFR